MKEKNSFSLGTADKNAVNALAPGIGTILCPFLKSSFSTTEPGSQIAGVPASETSATVPFSPKISDIFELLSFSLNL